MNLNLIFRTLTVPALQTVTLNYQGSVWMCKSATATFGLAIDGAQEIDMDAGWQVNVAPQYWRSLQIHNRNNTALVISYYLGTSGLAYSNQNTTFFQKNASTYAKGSGLFNLADGGLSPAYTGMDGSNLRKQFIVSNLSANIVYVIDGSGNEGVAVPANQSATFETGGQVNVKNTAGSGTSKICVMETFYT